MLNKYIKVMQKQLKRNKDSHVFVCDGFVEIYTKGGAWVVLNTHSEIANGIYSSEQLEELIANGEKVVPESSKDVGTMFHEPAGDWRKLSQNTIDQIIRCGGVVSKDLTRPALTGVQIGDGLVAATDGYRAIYYENGSLESATPLYIDPEVVGMLKVVGHVGEWRIRWDADRSELSNGDFTIIAHNFDYPFPRLRALTPTKEFQHLAVLDLEAIRKEYTKHINVVCINLSNGAAELHDADGYEVPRPLGSEAVVVSETTGTAGDGRFETTLIMPMFSNDENLIRVNLTLLKGIKGGRYLNLHIIDHQTPIVID